MKILLGLIILSTFFSKAYSQIERKEDYISSKSVSGTLLEIDNGTASIKGNAFLYYNDSCLLLHIDGAKNKTMFYKVFKKHWNNEKKRLDITCYDSTKLATYPNTNDLIKTVPDLIIFINYDAAMIFNEGYTKSTTIHYISVDCNFYNKGLKVGFGSDTKSQPNFIPIIRKKYSKSIIG